MNTAGIYVTAAILNTDLVFNVVSDADGAFVFPLLPAGNLEFRSESLQNGKYYYGQGILVLNGDKSLTVNMLYTDDLVAGVPEFTAESLSYGSAPSSDIVAASVVAGDLANVTADAIWEGYEPMTGSEDDAARGVKAEREAAHARYERARAKGAKSGTPTDVAATDLLSGKTASNEAMISSEAASVEATAEGEASVSVSAGQQNTPMTEAAVYSVPQGTKSVTLTYNISTAEYPYYVQAQSIYNDTWSLVVRGGGSGQHKFYIPRQINSQLSGDPIWQSDGSTGEIKEILDVENLAANSAATLTLFASAMNVGDSILPTSVNASLGNALTLQVNSVTPDTVAPTRGDSTYYSIPRPGHLNHHHRFFTVRITKPTTATVKSVKVRIGDLNNNNELMTVLDEGPGQNVTVNGNSIRVRVTMDPNASTINSTPPPTWRYFYRFDVTIEENGTEVSAYKDSARRNPLWRMPDNFARYSTRDTGGDDWCTHGTYLWMEEHRGLLRAINDISGEHSRDIGHATHANGRDIDMYHFYTFPGATTGGDNYNRFRNAVIAAAGGDADSRQRVSAFVTATRQGIDNLGALDTVTLMYYMSGGGGGSGLPANWATTLFQTGRITRTTQTGTQTLDLGLGDWSNAKYRPRADHHDHVHIALSPAL